MTLAKKQQPQEPVMEALAKLGQSIWIDSIDRSSLRSGAIRKLIDRGLRGLTSNPTIFEKAIAHTSQYDDQIRALLSHRDLEVKALFDELAVRDIQDACDLFSEVYKESDGQDGMVSLELAPFLAREAEPSIEEGRRLWAMVRRPNLMIKVPGTPEGLIAFEQLISEGINVNITLLFSREVYREFALGYLRALERRLERGQPIDRVASVASFFVSRIDAEVDKRLAEALSHTLDRKRRETLQSLQGKIAIANAKQAYAIFQEITSGPRWQKLKTSGAHPQRLLWASTSTKNPKYRDVLYIEELIGRDTVNTVPPKTLEQFEDHGRIRPSLTEAPEQARAVLERLDSVGISLSEITDKLLRDGITLFAEPYQHLMTALERKRRALLRPPLNSIELRLPILLETEIGRTLQKWKSEDRVRRLWSGDSTLWTQSCEEEWLGWLTIIDRQLERVDELKKFQAEVSKARYRDVVVLGMGGSSLCPDVLSTIYEPSDSFPDLHVLDSTHPEQIRRLEAMLDFKRTLFIVSSKSGTTLEPNLFLEYFYDQVCRAVGEKNAGEHFVAITDPGSELESLAQKRNFRHVYFGDPQIGGRYSAFSDFGMIPAAAFGMDVQELLLRASEMAHACGPNVLAEENPGLLLGAVLGTLGRMGKDKVTIICSPEIWNLGTWIEQLLAESTGKLGRALLPICEEDLGPPEVYCEDRQFIYLKLAGTQDRHLDGRVDALASAEFPVVRLEVSDCIGLVQEFFRWEFATAVAGSILQVNPFDQPDVEAAKVEARRLTNEFETSGALPGENPFFSEDAIALYADPMNAEALNALVGSRRTLPSYLQAHLERLRTGDYFATLAYLPMNFGIEEPLAHLRTHVRNWKKVATSVEFGPRYLHSTGQAHKGGPNTGVFLILTGDIQADVPIPSHKAGFGIVNRAQARGDLEVLARRGRRLLRLHLLGSPEAQLAKLGELADLARRFQESSS